MSARPYRVHGWHRGGWHGESISSFANLDKAIAAAEAWVGHRPVLVQRERAEVIEWNEGGRGCTVHARFEMQGDLTVRRVPDEEIR